MTELTTFESNHEDIIFGPQEFQSWASLNDTIMGGSSQALISVTSEGLLLEGDLIEEGGGFVSCRSPFIEPPLNLSKYKGLKLELEGDGRILKLAIACRIGLIGIKRLVTRDLRWVAAVPTQPSGVTTVNILFSSLQPTVRANRVSIPFPFNSSAIKQVQLLHSKFGQPGQLNPGFRPGSIKVLLRSISGFF